jgi:hypothetical protein
MTLTPLPADLPRIVIVEHMPEAFTRQLAARLDSPCKISVQRAKDRDRIVPGRVGSRRPSASAEPHPRRPAAMTRQQDGFVNPDRVMKCPFGPA